MKNFLMLAVMFACMYTGSVYGATPIETVEALVENSTYLDFTDTTETRNDLSISTTATDWGYPDNSAGSYLVNGYGYDEASHGASDFTATITGVRSATVYAVLIGHTASQYDFAWGSAADGSPVNVVFPIASVEGAIDVFDTGGFGYYVVPLGEFDGTGGSIVLHFGKGNPFNGVNAYRTIFDGVLVAPTTSYRGKAYNPDPYSGESQVELDLSLRNIANSVSWMSPDVPDDPEIVQVFGYNVYMDPNEIKVSNATASSPGTSYWSLGQTGTTFDPPADFDYNTTYFWRVDPIVDFATVPGSDIEDANTVIGGTWSFTTLPPVPVIISQPTEQFAKPGETATFTIDASSVSDLTYSWYQSADEVIDAGDTLLLSGIDEGTLNVSVNADELTAVSANSYYYCVLDNSNTPVTSDVVSLVVQRMTAHYTFDGTADDSAVLPHNGTWAEAGLATYNTTDPIMGSGAAVFNGADPNSYIVIGTDAAPSSNPKVRGDVAGTASYWIRTTSTSKMCIMGTINKNDSSAFQLNLNDSTPRKIVAFIRGASGSYVSLGYTTSIDVLDGQWHHLVFTWDTDAGILYIDGQKITQISTDNPVFSPWEYPMTIGRRNIRGVIDYPMTGEIDDLRVYNYALSQTECYDLYLTGPASYVCDQSIIPGWTELDVNDDCRLDLVDLAAVAQAWLDCYRYPASECNL